VKRWSYGANFCAVLAVRAIEIPDFRPQSEAVQSIVIERPKSDCSSFRLSIFLAMLGTCVFLWGFAYKLSLYDTHRPTLHRIPEAKLLSKNEDTNATDSVRLCLSSAVSAPISLVFSAVLISLAVFGACGSLSQKIPKTPDAPGPQLRFILSAFFFRPPPVHFAL